MFYSQFILAKKGPLGTIWIAAHLERKLRKNQVADTDIGVSVDSILFPDVPIALRLSSHLLLGVVRIYSRKVNYLFDDCSEALLKVKQAFRSTAVDLPPEESTAPYHSITLPETFDLDDFELPDSDHLQGNYDHHVSSRDQITLQDNMEGINFSTTQFGLDERFGDEDTSGFDLDEELFMSKVTAPGKAEVVEASDPETHQSTQPLTPFDLGKDVEDTHIDTETVDLGGYDDDPMDYSHAPSTPGLLEEPNFSKVQGAVCDDHLDLGDDPKFTNVQDVAAGNDHMEIEDLNMCAAKDNTGSIDQNSDLHHEMPHAVSSPLPTDTNSIPVSDAEENRTIDAENKLHSAHDGVSSNNGPTTHSVDGAFAEREETLENMLDNNILENVLDNSVAHPSSSHEAPVQGDSSANPSSVTETVSEKSFFQFASEGLVDPYQDARRPEDEELLLPVNNVLVSDIAFSGGRNPEDPKTQAYQEPKDSRNLNVAFGNMHILQRCNHLDQPCSINNGCSGSGTVHLPSGVNGPFVMDTSGFKEVPDAPEASTVIQGEGYHAPDSVAPVLEKFQATEPALHEDIRVGSLFPAYTLSENRVASETSELPAVEKLLSVPEMFANPQNNMLEFTPANTQFETAIGADAGRKRSFAESSLTMQSIDSVESFEVARSKRAKESVPDDNDLLSSILVGRRSSVFKVKETPPVQERVRMKRPRTTPRPSALKRKVLMDDTMVLHGDVIRQQLMNTEAIRRTRKKAPCTRSEIWMLQKSLLEDEIFSEPILTGLSPELASLHTRTYDLSQIRISLDDTQGSIANAAPEDENDPRKATNDSGLSAEPIIDKEIATEGFIESNIVGNDMVAGCPDIQEALDHLFESTDNGMGTTVVAEPQSLSHEQSAFVAEIHSEHPDSEQNPPTGPSEPQSLSHEQPALVAEVDSEHQASELNPPTGPVAEFALATNPAFGYNPDMAASSIIPHAPLNQETNIDSSFHIEASDQPSDQKLEPPSVETEIAGDYISSEDKDYDAVRIPEENGDSGAVGDAVREKSPPKEMENGASFDFAEGMQNACNQHADMTMEQSLHDIFGDTQPSVAACAESDRPVDLNDMTLDQSLQDMFQEELPTNEVEFVATGLDNNGKVSTSYGSEEEPNLSVVHPEELAGYAEGATMNGDEYPSAWETDQQGTVDTDIVSGHADIEDDTELGYALDGHDTGFLNDDDDDIAEEDDSYAPSPDQTEVDYIGWSSRTRAVAKYLQVLFDKEPDHGKKTLPMDNLLVGKTRKEASRMFFEALVLKTRDYVHVEQANPFDKINIKPGVKMTKYNV